MPSSVYVCRSCDGGRRLGERLAHDGLVVRAVGCQKICSHHVVGVRHGSQLVWFRRVDTKARRRALRRLLTEPARTRLPKRLRSLVVTKRAGRLRH